MLTRRGLIALAVPALALGARRAQAVGPFPLQVEYVADATYGAGQRAREGRLWRTRYALRQESIESGRQQVIIARFDRNLAWVFMPGVRMAIETDLAALNLPVGALTDGTGVRLAAEGSEFVMGLPTTRYRVETVPVRGGAPAASFRGLIWSTAQGIVMRIDGQSEYKGRRSDVKAAFRNVRTGTLDRNLFEAPPGYSRMQASPEELQQLIESFRGFRLPR